jgi:hypothetical protein
MTAADFDAVAGWAGAGALLWVAQTLHALARAAHGGAAELTAIRRGLGLPGPQPGDTPPPPPFPLTVTVQRPHR